MLSEEGTRFPGVTRKGTEPCEPLGQPIQHGGECAEFREEESTRKLGPFPLRSRVEPVRLPVSFALRGKGHQTWGVWLRSSTWPSSSQHEPLSWTPPPLSPGHPVGAPRF